MVSLGLNVIKSKLVVSSETAETQRCVGATKPKGVSEGDPWTLRPPGLGRAGNIVQVELWFCAVQVECWGYYSMVAGESGEGRLQSAGSPEQVPRGSLGGGHSQTVSTGLEEPLDGCVFCCVS